MLTRAVSSVPISGIICDSLPILPDMAKAKLVVQVRAGAINQQSSIHNSYDENHIQERLSPPILMRIDPYSRMTVQSLSMAHSVMLNNIEIYL